MDTLKFIYIYIYNYVFIYEYKKNSDLFYFMP